MATATPYPRAIVTCLEELAQILTRHASAERGADLATHEQGLLAAWGAIRGPLLAAVVQTATTSLQPGGVPRRTRCPSCGAPGRAPETRPRIVQTVCGPIRLRRPWYVCTGRCGCPGWSPADQTVGLAGDVRVSATLHGWLSELGACASFRDGRRLLATLAQLPVAAETIRQHTRREGEHLEAQQQQAIAALAQPRTAADVTSPEPAPGQLTVETDGAFVRYRDRRPDDPTDRGWREVKLGVVGGWVPSRRQARQPAECPERAAAAAGAPAAPAGQLVAKSYVAARAEAAVFGPRLAAEAARRGALEVEVWSGPRTGRGVAQLRAVVVLGDGAGWIWHLADTYFGQRVEILDFYHAAQHLTQAASLAFGTDTAAAQAWAAQQRRVLRDQGPEPVRVALRALPTPSDPLAAQALQRERQFFRTHAPRMAYPTFQAQGLPIGSGAVEGTAAHLVLRRLKLPSCRWSEPGAHAVLQVRCHLLTRDERLASVA